MRASFKLLKGTLVITLDGINAQDREKNVQLELALLRAYGYDRASYWAWKGNEGEGMNRCVVSLPMKTEDDLATAQKVLADFCV